MQITRYTTDTSEDAEAVRLELVRQMPPAVRLARSLRLSCELLRHSKAAIRRKHPECSEREVALKFVELHYGAALSQAIALEHPAREATALDWHGDLIPALEPVVQVLRQLGIRHYIGGSVASSFHGAMRSTMDVDVIADMAESQVSEFVRWLGQDYYASEPAIRDAIRRKSCFNLIHYATSFKIDIFAHRGRSYDERAFSRAAAGALDEAGTLIVPMATAEDTILSKLEWYRAGDEVSERQWNDVTIVLKLLGQDADLPYLRDSAEQLGIADLLQRLLEQDRP